MIPSAIWRFLSKNTPLIVGGVFLYSGVYKLLHPAGATAALISLDVNRGWAIGIILLLTVVEIYLGAILLLKMDLKWGISVTSGLTFLFAIFLWYLSILANPPACGCMGLTQIFRSNRHNAIFGLVRNCAILWLLKGAYDYYCRKPVTSASTAAA